MQHGPRIPRKAPFVATTVRVAAGLALLTSLQAQAQFTVVCDDSPATTSNSGFAFCEGPFLGALNGATELTELTDLFGGSWKSAGKSNDGTGSPFTTNPAGNLVGTLNFKAPVNGVFVIGLQGTSDGLGLSWHSFYGFSTGGAPGVSSLNFDTLGLYKSLAGSGSRSPQLAFASLYQLNPVPEPATTGLLVGGLGVLAWMARRRTAKDVPADGSPTA